MQGAEAHKAPGYHPASAIIASAVFIALADRKPADYLLWHPNKKPFGMPVDTPEFIWKGSWFMCLDKMCSHEDLYQQFQTK